MAKDKQVQPKTLKNFKRAPPEVPHRTLTKKAGAEENIGQD